MNVTGQGPSWQWAKDIQGRITPYSSVSDNSGNYYVAGWFIDSILTADTINIINPNPCCYNRNLAVAKYNSMGDLIWAKGFNSGKGFAVSITIDNNGFLLMTGTFESPSLEIDGISLTNTSVDATDIFISKMDTLGNLIFIKNIGGTSNENATGISTDGNFFYVFGSSNSPFVNFGNNILNISGSFISKYSNSGDCIWIKPIGTNAGFYNGLRDVTVDQNGNIYATGSFGGTSITFDSITLLNTGMWYSNDMYIVKYNYLGNVIWAKSYYYGFGNDESGSRIVTDNFGNFYVLGYFDSGINLDSILVENLLYSGSPSMFIAKFNSEGTAIWADGNHSDGTDLAKDSDGNIYISGYFSDSTVTFNGYTLTNSINGNGYLVKYDSSGIVQSAIGIGGGGNSSLPYTISLDADKNVFIAGNFSSPDLIFGSTTLNNLGSQSMFAAKYGIRFNLGLNDLQRQENIIISPNPVASKTTIYFSEEQKNSTIRIFDMKGKEISTLFFSGKELTLDKGTMENGIYFVQIIDKQFHISTKKIIIQ